MRCFPAFCAPLLVFLAACDKVPKVSDEDVLNGFLKGYVIQGKVQDVERHGGLRMAAYTFIVEFDEDFKRDQVQHMGLEVVKDEERRAEFWRYFQKNFDLEGERLEDFELHQGIMNSLQVWMFLSGDHAMFYADRII